MSVRRKCINPEALFQSEKYGFSQAVKATGQTTLYVSGQVGWNREQQMENGRDLGQQTRQALANVEIAVRAAGGDRNNIVSLRIYILESQIHNDRPVTDALLAFFPQDQLPAASFIGVPALANRDFLVEVEAVAVL